MKKEPNYLRKLCYKMIRTMDECMQEWEAATGLPDDMLQRHFRVTRETIERVSWMEDDTLIDMYGNIETK